MGDQPPPEAKLELTNLELQHELILAKMEAACSKEEGQLLETQLETSTE